MPEAIDLRGRKRRNKAINKGKFINRDPAIIIHNVRATASAVQIVQYFKITYSPTLATLSHYFTICPCIYRSHIYSADKIHPRQQYPQWYEETTDIITIILSVMYRGNCN